MKRIIFTCITGLALLLSLSLNGQDAGRTAATKIGDALNQLPAQNEALFVRLMEDLLSTGEEGILLLADKMKFSEKLYWMAYYYTRHPKGRFELSHILQLLAFWAVCILVCEMVLYLWLNG